MLLAVLMMSVIKVLTVFDMVVNEQPQTETQFGSRGGVGQGGSNTKGDSVWLILKKYHDYIVRFVHL